jgi:succinate dehydrogenase/fumarate reductase flavoprotein subunit
VRERYGNLFDIYHEITDENAYKVPMRIFPAVHYTMGGLWVDYNLMSNVPGLFVLGEANFSDHGANRLGASALMQGLADGYFVLPYTVGDYLATQKPGSRPRPDAPEFAQAEENVRSMTDRLLSIKGKEPVSHFHKRLGHIMWQHCGMARNKAGLEKALQEIPALRAEFWSNVNVPGSGRLAQPVARAGGPRRRLPRARRAHVPRRPDPRGELRLPFPRGAPVPRRRVQARRRQLRPRRRLGVRGRGQGARPQRRAARLRVVKMSVRNYK